MHIAGHVGFTIGFFTLLNKNRNLTYKTCLILAIVALLPDILDSGVHLMIDRYPNHGIFHLLLFYGLLLPLTFITTAIKYINSSNPPIPPFLKGGEGGFKLFVSQSNNLSCLLFTYASVMGANVIFDMVNVDLRALMYPMYGWTENYKGKAIPSPIESFFNSYPNTIGYKLSDGHFRLFEAIGIMLIFLVLLKNFLTNKKTY